MFKKILFLIFVIISLSFSINNNKAFAIGEETFNNGTGKEMLEKITGNKSDGGTGQSNVNSVTTIVNKIVTIFLGLASTIFLIFLVVGGLQYLGSKGDTSKIKDSFSLIKTGIIGLIIITLAYSITTFVFSQIEKIST